MIASGSMKLSGGNLAASAQEPAPRGRKGMNAVSATVSRYYLLLADIFRGARSSFAKKKDILHTKATGTFC
jgi:hypothetical protein